MAATASSRAGVPGAARARWRLAPQGRGSGAPWGDGRARGIADRQTGRRRLAGPLRRLFWRPGRRRGQAMAETVTIAVGDGTTVRAEVVGAVPFQRPDESGGFDDVGIRSRAAAAGAAVTLTLD